MLAVNILDARSLLTAFGSVGIAVVLFAETGLLVGLFLPGDSLLFTAGVLSATSDRSTLHLTLGWALIAAAIGALAGAQTGYALGRAAGPRLLERSDGSRIAAGAARTSEFLDRYGGGKAIVLARFIPVVRTVINPLVGALRLPVRTFVVWQVVGGLVWTTGVMLAGWALGSHIHNIDHYLLPVIAVIVIVSLVPIGWEVLRARRTSKQSSDANPASHRRRLRLRWLVPAVVLVLLSPAIYSYATTMLQPSSLPLRVRSVEWLRTHHGNWLVDGVEHVYYGWWKAPHKGGPGLTALPHVGSRSVTTAPNSAAGPSRRATLGVGSAARTWPPPIKPVITPALPGEGEWKRTGPEVAGGPPVLVTDFRPLRSYPRVVAYVAWFDHTRTELGFYPGRYEPPRAAVRGPMQVPFGQRSRLLATFNAGFIYTDGLNGSSDNGRTNEPLKDGLATLVGDRDGRVDIVVWHGGPNPGPQYAFTRQSLPPIVWNDKLNPDLNNGSEWGYTLGNAVRVWRTGVGIDRRGNLIYAAADDQTVESLARLLQRAGAVKAMQFDINPEWPTLITYRHRRGLVPDKIVPNVQQPATRYLVPDDRDFFAVYTPIEGRPVSVPFE